MDKDKSFRFERRWTELEKQRKDLDFHIAEWCREVRGEYPKGDNGDQSFCDWCVAHICATQFGARELLLKANAATVVTDERTWKEIGGYRAIKHLVDLPRRDQVSVLEAAKTQYRAPINIMRERGLIARPEPKPAPVVKRDPFPLLPKSVTPDAHVDAVALAQYIARTSKSIPRDILEIVNRYRFFMQKAA